MPVKLIPTYTTGVITGFQFQRPTWIDRLVGDDDTNGTPDFITNEESIRDIFFYKNRLGFITDTGVAISQVGEYYNLFRTTVATVLDSDPIITSASTTNMSTFEHVIMNQDKIFIFSSHTQFVLEGGLVLSPSSIKITEASHYNFNMDVKPIVMGNKIIVASKTKNYGLIYQYVYDESAGIAVSNELTQHVSQYIDEDIQSLVASEENDSLLVVAKDPHADCETSPTCDDKDEAKIYTSTDNIIYLYKTVESAGKIIQSAWSKWKYQGDVLSLAAFDGTAYMALSTVSEVSQADTVIGSGVWVMNNVWKMTDMNWLMSYTETVLSRETKYSKQAIDIDSYKKATSQLANCDLNYRDYGVDLIDSYVDIGEIVASDSKKPYSTAKTFLKGMKIDAEPGSLYNIEVWNLKTSKARLIKPKYTMRFAGAGLAGNVSVETIQKLNLHVSGIFDNQDDFFDTTAISGDGSESCTDTTKTSVLAADDYDTMAGDMFDVSPIGHVNNYDSQTYDESSINDPMMFRVSPNIFIGGDTVSTRVRISAYDNGSTGFGFNIYSIDQELQVVDRSKLL